MSDQQTQVKPVSIHQDPVKTGLPTNGSENPGVQANLMALSGFSVTPPNVNMEPQKWGFGRSFSY